jgi:DNA invertase Pin-like site-specific DNA recombinase
MIVGYARVSTSDQTASLQTDALTAAGAESVFTETAGGTNRERPELAQCLKTLRTGDQLIVWKLDRLARSLQHLVQIISDLDNRGIAFRSLTESIDTASAGGRLVFHIFGALAEFEHALIRERTIAGLAASRARGRIGGRPVALNLADTRAAAAMLMDARITKQEVAKRFGVTRATLNASLKRAGITDPVPVSV